jgi:hypothetical protein
VTEIVQNRLIVGPYRFRVRTDVEGFPIMPGRYGRIEWCCDGVDCHSCPLPGQVALAVYTDRARLFGKLWAIPGVKRHQTGDREMRAVFPPEALEQVASVIRAHKKPGITSEAGRKIGLGTAFGGSSRLVEPRLGPATGLGGQGGRSDAQERP